VSRLEELNGVPPGVAHCDDETVDGSDAKMNQKWLQNLMRRISHLEELYNLRDSNGIPQPTFDMATSENVSFPDLAVLDAVLSEQMAALESKIGCLKEVVNNLIGAVPQTPRDVCSTLPQFPCLC